MVDLLKSKGSFPEFSVAFPSIYALVFPYNHVFSASVCMNSLRSNSHVHETQYTYYSHQADH